MIDIRQIIVPLQSTKRPWVSRFAPSPTGFLHLGHVYAAEWVWQVAGALGAKVLLRIEDHDRGRVRPEYIEAIGKDLDWLGYFAHELAPLQSLRYGRYEDCLSKLTTKGLVYRCDCTRRQIRERISETGELRYDGHCRERGLSLSGEGSLRLIVEDVSCDFEDLLGGSISQRPARQCGDFILRDRDGYWSYHFAVVIDDYDQGVNLVIRGKDILDSTGRQIYLQQALGFDPVSYYLHHDLLQNAAGEKLSKRQKSASIAELREKGCDPKELRDRVKSMMDSYR